MAQVSAYLHSVPMGTSEALSPTCARGRAKQRASDASIIADIYAVISEKCLQLRLSSQLHSNAAMQAWLHGR